MTVRSEDIYVEKIVPFIMKDAFGRIVFTDSVGVKHAEVMHKWRDTRRLNLDLVLSRYFLVYSVEHIVNST